MSVHKVIDIKAGHFHADEFCLKCLEPRGHHAFVDHYDADDTKTSEAPADLIRVSCGAKTRLYHKACFAQLKDLKEDGWPKCPFCAKMLPLSDARKAMLLKIAAVTAAVVLPITGALLVPVIANAALGGAGFTAVGPAAGTAAAAWQASIGNVAAGSMFATCQGVAMGAAIPAAWTALGATAGAGVAAVGTGVGVGVTKFAAFVRKRREGHVRL